MILPTQVGIGLRTVSLLTALALLTGCSSIGPVQLKRDRFNYSNALSRSAQEQMLLNLIRLRYLEVPVFLDVSSVVNQYSVEGDLGGSAGWGWNAITGASESQGVRADTSYSDRPTVTYSPRRGDEFTRSLLRPIPPISLFALAQAGYAADFLFLNSSNAINGIYNRFSAGERARPADPEFPELMKLMREIQQSGAAGIRIEEKNDQDAALLFFTRDAPPEIDRKIREWKRMMGLDPNKKEFLLTYGAMARDDSEIAVLSRSLLEMMGEYASYIDVPQEHIDEQRTWPPPEVSEELPPLMTIKSGPERDRNAATAVKYRDHWFWIDDRDFQSKRAFIYLMIIASLTETGEASAPLLTIPAG